jgi:ferric-dicitrate binding protein FerR (iron transport regulator)
MPPFLTQAQLKEYAEKWLKGTITPEEKELFEQWYNNQPPDSIEWPGDETEGAIQEKIFNNLQQAISEDNNNTPVVKQRWLTPWRMAASVAALILLSVAVLKWPGSHDKKLPAQASSLLNKTILDKTTDYTRHLTLPDGSTVVLRANSKLDYSGNFSGNSREVILVGEAYFDIVHDEKRPFIIHTGEVKTTVLGTAFYINANPGSKKITIAVTRGKVRVEKNQQVLAVLAPDQQVTYNPEEQKPGQQQKVNALAIVTDWTKQEMVFEDISFEKAIQLLSRRYNVAISFKNPALQNCTIKGYFNGTESLEKVLDVLCIISNSSYTIAENKSILLDGQGCEK